jgi:hypothetical protein
MLNIIKSNIGYIKNHLRQEEIRKKTPKIFSIPNASYLERVVIELDASSTIVFNLLCWLERHSDVITPSQVGWLVKKSGLSLSTVKRCLKYLQAVNLIRIISQGFKKRCIYQIASYFLNPDVRKRLRKKIHCFDPLGFMLPVDNEPLLYEYIYNISTYDVDLTLRCPEEHPKKGGDGVLYPFDSQPGAYGPRGNSPQPFPYSDFEKIQSGHPMAVTSGDPEAVNARQSLIVGSTNYILQSFQYAEFLDNMGFVTKKDVYVS